MGGEEEKPASAGYDTLLEVMIFRSHTFQEPEKVLALAG